MNGTMNQTMKEMMTPMMQSAMNKIQVKAIPCEAVEAGVISEECRGAGFSLAAFAGSVLLCLGIIVYALIGA